jgi:predicted HTH transcriptional regulator
VALGPLKSALGYSSTDGTYGFLRPVVVQVMEFEGHEGFNAEELAGGEKQISPQNVSKKLIEDLKSWNPRQLEVMAKLRAANRESRSLTGRIVRPKQLIETYGVSRITAGRDLAELAEKGLLIRIGSGRGTGYMLNT